MTTLFPDIELLRRLEEEVHKEIALTHPALLKAYPISSYVTAIESRCVPGQPWYLPPAAYAYSKGIEELAGPAVTMSYNKLLLLTLMKTIESRVAPGDLPETVLEQYALSLVRMAHRLQKNHSGYFNLSNGHFRLDLGICRGRFIPCGIEVADQLAGVPRRLLVTGGLGQLFGGLWFVLRRLRGFRPVYETHMDPRLLAEFSAEGYRRFYLRMAELLERNPGIKGMISSSWWNDPKLGEISPQLAFLRREPEGAGARRFRVGHDEVTTSDALRNSQIRRALFEAGTYRPTRYAIVWARQDIIEWARATTRSRCA